jgi:tetratricopeptide (TPR) repeat protein
LVSVILSGKWSRKMRISRVGILILVSLSVLMGSNCAYYNRIIARKNLVDGAKAYKDRKYKEAEGLFRAAVNRDPDGKTEEGKTAQLFLARTLHSQYVGNRSENSLAEQAIEAYKKVLTENIGDNSSFKAVANLYENLGKNDEWLKWVTDRSNNEAVPPEQRAEALTTLAARKYSCANEISDKPEVKKEVTKGTIKVYEFKKPENTAEFDTLVQCTNEGYALIEKALELDKKAGIESDSTYSYKANLLVQKMRIAEMDGKTEEKEAIKKEAEAAKAKFSTLAAEKKKKQDEEEAKKKAAEAANKK